VKLHVAWIQARRGKEKSSGTQTLVADYLERLRRHVTVETHECADESEILRVYEKSAGTRLLIALDERGRQMSSEEFAEWLRTHQDRGTKHIFFAVGGADGFSTDFLRAAKVQLSLGKMTLPHSLARVILLEQLYRAYTILKGHPYHSGH
jgi:23S rRNA (pseudouridine1915-N3)-methyltransferase